MLNPPSPHSVPPDSAFGEHARRVVVGARRPLPLLLDRGGNSAGLTSQNAPLKVHAMNREGAANAKQERSAVPDSPESRFLQIILLDHIACAHASKHSSVGCRGQPFR